MESAHVEPQSQVVSIVGLDNEPTKDEKPCPRCERRRERERGYAREARKRKKAAAAAEEEEEGEVKD